MSVYHFVNPDLRIDNFFGKKGDAENLDAVFQIMNIGTSAHFYCRLKKIS